MMLDEVQQVPGGLMKAEPGDSEGVQENVSGVSLDTVKVIAESMGIIGLPNDACREVSEDVTYRLRVLAQNAEKFMNHGKRRKLLCSDIDHALKVQGQEPLYGLQATEQIPFRYSSGGGRELHFLEDKELDLNDLVNNQLPKIPMAPTLRSHWLAIDGIQPAIPENPPPQSKDQLVTDSVDPAAILKSSDVKVNKLSAVLGQAKMKTVETVNVKQLASHELSVEQQLYFKEITEACVGSDEPRRAEALQSLACDPGLHQMLPRLATFIAEGVRVNVVQHNLAILIYLMRMVKSLLENQTLYLEKYLHELIPAVATCIVSRQLCSRPDHDNHWALRDFASRMMAAICKNFHTSTNNIQTRVTKMFSDALKSERAPLVSYYGAIAGLQELGPDVIKVFILPNISILAEKIDIALDPNSGNIATSSVEKIAAQNIRTLLVKSVSPVLKTMRDPPDDLEAFKLEFGSLGPHLHSGVERARKQSGSKQTAGSSSSAARTPGLVSTPRPPAQHTPGQQKVFLMNPQVRGGVDTPSTPQHSQQVRTMVVPENQTTPQMRTMVVSENQNLSQVRTMVVPDNQANSQMRTVVMSDASSSQMRTMMVQDGGQGTPQRPGQQGGVRTVFPQNLHQNHFQ